MRFQKAFGKMPYRNPNKLRQTHIGHNCRDWNLKWILLLLWYC